MSEKKNSSMLFIIIGLVLVAGAAGFFIMNSDKSATTNETTTEQSAEVNIETDVSDEAEANTETSPDDIPTENATTEEDGDETEVAEETTTDGTSGAAVDIDVEKAMSVRAIGNPDAPVVIKEYASLTCGHCGQFHSETLDQLKTEYIDTGKVYLIFNDFPLNGPALNASMVARCLDESRYYNFISLLFKNQEDWAYDPANYMTYLRQNAALAGLDNNAFDSCINNEELKTALTEKMRSEQQKYSINSTPTFVINEDNVLTGARDYKFYSDAIEQELAGN